MEPVDQQYPKESSSTAIDIHESDPDVQISIKLDIKFQYQ